MSARQRIFVSFGWVLIYAILGAAIGHHAASRILGTSSAYSWQTTKLAILIWPYVGAMIGSVVGLFTTDIVRRLSSVRDRIPWTGWTLWLIFALLVWITTPILRAK